MEKMRLGNGLWERTLFNTRLQPSEIGLSASPTNFTDTTQYLKWRVNYSYVTSASSGRDNNGNLRSQMISAPGFAAPLVQSYQYDQLNRISSAQETQNGLVKWTQAFSYDRFGNRRIVAASTTSSLRGLNASISTSNNRINTSGYGYDEVGNLTRTPITTTTSHTYAYDAENRMVSYDTSAANYSYDGDGRRVKTQVGTGSLRVTTLYVYNAFGQMVAEYNNSGQGVDGGRQYLTQDHLGSTRVITKADKSVKARSDYLPFGEEVGVGFSGRGSVQGYNNIALTRQKFTGKERDIETGLDYFIARYYVSTQGRFTSPDPLLSSGTIYDPQTWNRYAYTLNNPLKYTDPFGLYEYAKGTDDKLKKIFEKGYAKLVKARDHYKGDKNSKEYRSLDRALTALGKPNEANGVTVQFGKTSNGAPAETSPPGLTLSGLTITGSTSTVKVDLSRFGDDDNGTLLLAVAVGHEGTHVADNQAIVAGLPTNALAAQGVIESGRGIMSRLQTEHSAYETSSYVAQALFPNSNGFTVGNGYEIWNHNWAATERDVKRNAGIEGVLRDPSGSYRFSPYGFKEPFLQPKVNDGGPVLH